MKWKRLIIEAKTPSDMESINASFNKDVSDEKFTPTVEFMKVVYNKMNKEFFFNYLPFDTEIRLSTRQMGVKNEIGFAPYVKSTTKHEVTPKAIVLNSSYKFTLHGWIEVMLHEMIHVSDCLLNPDRFYDSNYNPHGDWFMKQGQRFKKHGFNVEQYCSLEHDVSDDMEKDEELDNPNVFIVFNKSDSASAKALRIDMEDKDKAIEMLRNSKVVDAFLVSTKNPCSEELDKWIPGQTMVVSPFTKPFRKYYGPFRREELLDLSEPISESEEDELDKYMKIARTIKGVTKVYRQGDEVIVWLS